MSVEYELDGQRCVHINGRPQVTSSEAASSQIDCADQAEVDHYRDALVDGGQESQCGWLEDRYGSSWQVVPAGMDELSSEPDPGPAQRVIQAMLQMRTLDVAALRPAADAVPA